MTGSRDSRAKGHTWANRYALASIYRYIDIDMDFEADFDIDIETHPFSIYRYIDGKAWQPLQPKNLCRYVLLSLNIYQQAVF